MRFSDLWPLTKQSAAEWLEDKASRLAASLAYYTMLSIAPLLIISIKVIGLVFGAEAARGGIEQYLAQTVGAKGAAAAQEIIKHAGESGSGVLATLISTIVLLFSASGVFGELQDAIDTIWEVKPKPDRTWRDVVRERFFSFALVFGVIFLLLVTLVINTALSALTHVLGGQQIFWQLANVVVSTAVVICLFAMIFKYLPDAQVRWRYVWVGATVTGVLFTFGKFLLAWYLGRASTTSVYGAAGSLVALLIWVYYSGQILFFGAEFTQVYAKRHGHGAVAAENAVKVTEAERAQVGAPHRNAILAAADPSRKQPTIYRPRPALRKRSSSWPIRAIGLAGGAIVVFLAEWFSQRELRSQRQWSEDELSRRIERVRSEIGSIRRFERSVQVKNVADRIDAVERKIHEAIKRAAPPSAARRMWHQFSKGWRRGVRTPR